MRGGRSFPALGLSLLFGERGFHEDIGEAGVTNACSPHPPFLLSLGFLGLFCFPLTHWS